MKKFMFQRNMHVIFLVLLISMTSCWSTDKDPIKNGNDLSGLNSTKSSSDFSSPLPEAILKLETLKPLNSWAAHVSVNLFEDGTVIYEDHVLGERSMVKVDQEQLDQFIKSLFQYTQREVYEPDQVNLSIDSCLNCYPGKLTFRNINSGEMYIYGVANEQSDINRVASKILSELDVFLFEVGIYELNS